MFGFGKKKSSDKLEELKKQLMELKQKEKELDAKAKKEKKEVPKAENNIDVNKKVSEEKEMVPSELNDEAPMIVKDKIEGVVLEIGAGMSLNIPIRPRMNIKEFIEIAERVKALAALNFEDRK